jgi:hypothetical protein
MKKVYNFERFTEVAAEMGLDCVVLYDEVGEVRGVIIGDEEFIDDFAEGMSTNKEDMQ